MSLLSVSFASESSMTTFGDIQSPTPFSFPASKALDGSAVPDQQLGFKFHLHSLDFGLIPTTSRNLGILLRCLARVAKLERPT
jgi:hypothetical protein